MDRSERKYAEIILILLLYAATAFVGMLRFGTSYPNFPDSAHYLEMVEFFRGNLPVEGTRSPFSYRLLYPWVVSLLPTDPALTMSRINFLLLFVLAYVMYLITRSFGYGIFSSVCATGLCMISHPVMQYGSSVLVETPFMLLLAVGVYGIRKQWDWKRLAVLTIVGVGFKETALILALVYLVTQRFAGDRDWYKGFYIAIAGGITYLLSRLVMSGTQGGAGWYWVFRLTNLLVRPWESLEVIYLSFLFISVPIVAAVIWRINEEWNFSGIDRFEKAKMWFVLVGVPLSALAWVSFFFAHFSVRFIWPMYLGLLPLIAFGIEQILYMVFQLENRSRTH